MGWEKSRRRPQSGLASEGLPVSSGESPVCDEAAHFEALFSETQHGVGIPETRSALFLLTWNCACLSACTELAKGRNVFVIITYIHQFSNFPLFVSVCLYIYVCTYLFIHLVLSQSLRYSRLASSLFCSSRSIMIRCLWSLWAPTHVHRHTHPTHTYT